MQFNSITDDRALARAAQTDAQAFGALYDRYVQRVYRYCYYRYYRTNNVQEANDLTAPIFLTALEGYSLAGIKTFMISGLSVMFSGAWQISWKPSNP